jgi:Ulp1 family protease
MAATVDPRTFLLSSFLYTGHVKNGDFDGVTRWVQGLPRVRSRWVFGICEAAHWVAIEMNWECSSIRYYEPRPQKASVRRSESLAQHVQAWANDLCRADNDHSRVWELRQLQGPSSNAGDESNCGVYVCWAE